MLSSVEEVSFAYGPPVVLPRYTLYPVTLELLALQDKLTLCWTAGVPLPVRASLTGEPAALVAKDKLADAAPLDWGVKTSANDAVPPAGIVTGKTSPLSVNSVLFTETEETVTLAPLALKVAGMLLLAPTATLPKLKLPGFTENCPAAVPFPDTETAG